MKKEKYERWKSMDRILSGIFLMSFVLGSIFSIILVRYSFWILVAFTLILYFYFTTVFLSWFVGDKIGKRTQIFGFIGIVLLTSFFGIQMPQVPFKILVFIAGIVFVVLGLIRYFRVNDSYVVILSKNLNIF